MSSISDPSYLSEQYGDASNLNARFAIHERFSTNKLGWHRWVYERFALPPRCQILELGCGPAYLWATNLSRIPAGWSVVLSDFSPGMLEDAQQNLADRAGRFRFEVVDAQSIPFEDHSFDAVIANHMLYHLPDMAKALSEIRRVLKPDGRLYASTVGHAHMQELGDLIVEFDPQTTLWIRSPIRGFTLETGAAQLSPWFSEVTLHRYEDALTVTEAEPLVAYLLSSATPDYVRRNRATLAEFLERKLAQEGAIHVTKDSGLFEAFRGPAAT
jgi:ubiquinone/menaquinone biosynthesis C-methylase UbiE